MKKEAVRMAVLLLAGGVSAPAQTDPGLSTKPAGLTVTGERIAPEEKAADLSRPEPASLGLVATEEEQAFLQAAEDGQTWAKARLGIIYVNTPHDPARMELGHRMLEQAAGQDSADALFELAKMALAGRGMEWSPSAAFDYMRRAAELGLPEAQYELATMFADGRGTMADEEAALDWAKKAAVQGHTTAQHTVGISLLRHAATPEDLSEGLAFLEEAASQNHREALMVFAGILTRGEFGLPKDEAKAEALLKPRASEGDAQFQFGLATLYLYGETFSTRRQEARTWLHKSAASGFEQSQRLLEKLPRKEESQQTNEMGQR